MAVGQNANVINLSYVAVGRETTYGSYNTCTAGINVLSSSLKMIKETKILEELQTSRTNSNFIQLSRKLEGDLEFYFSPKSVACNYLLQNAFGGGPVTSATATGETVGGGAFTHTIDIANFNATYSSLCLNTRKGDSSTGKIFQYSGLRVNEITFSAQIDEALVASVSLIGKDATVTTNDVSSALNTTAQTPLSFVNGRFSVENSLNSLTTSSFWHVQSVELKVSNNLKSGSESRRIGSDTLDVLPAGMANFELSCEMRFDTTTAYDAMMAGTRLVGQLEFLGDTLSGSALREGLKLTLPYLVIADAGDPELSGDDVLTSKVTFAVLRDPTASGYALRAAVTNATSSYA